MSPSARRGTDLWHRLWRIVRHDIGRKLTAVVMAVALWSTLQNLVTASQPLELQVHSVATQQDADSQRLATAGVYLVVPSELIVSKVSEPRVQLTVTGPRDEVAGLNLSAVLPFFVTELGDADEVTLKRPLERDVFTVPRGQNNPRMTGFRVRPEVLEVTLARRESAELTLTSENVVTAGKPKDGYQFRSSRISLSPSIVGITGPRKVIEPLLADPGKLKLAPVAMTGRSVTVSQFVGLAPELAAQGVTLISGNGQVLVTVPIDSEDITKDLIAVPIEYRNEDVLKLRHQRATGYPRTFDIRVVGPPAEINSRTTEELLANMLLVFDWSLAPSTFRGQTRGNLSFARLKLPDTVRVTDTKDNKDLTIEYSLEDEPANGAAGANGANGATDGK